MRAVRGTAIYTGGGIYVTIGQMDNGMYFIGSEYGIEFFDTDTRSCDENGDMCGFDMDWHNKHVISDGYDPEEAQAAFKDFCERLDAKEEHLTDGYEEFSNFCHGEIALSLIGADEYFDDEEDD